MTRIAMTLKLTSGDIRTRGFSAGPGVTVGILLTSEEQKQVEDGIMRLREEDGAWVPISMEAVDGLVLELVTPETGEGSKASQSKFSCRKAHLHNTPAEARACNEQRSK